MRPGERPGVTLADEMSLSRQLRRAAERAQRKQDIKARKNSEVAEQTAADANPGPEPFGSEPGATVEAVPERIGPTGPRTPTGKAISSLNHLKHGLTGAFRVLAFESQSDFDAAHEALIGEHQPATPTESELVRRMAEHAWLSRRAQKMQDKAVRDCNAPMLALSLRYQTTQDRGFRACLNQLFRLRREQRAAAKQFESQKREAGLHQPRVRLAKSAPGSSGPLCTNSEAPARHFEMEIGVKNMVDAPIPGDPSVVLEQLKELFQTAMLSLQCDKGGKAAA